MAFYVVQFLTGLASAASLFLVASGLSIIFGVTRIVNFAHGAFYMLGAYVAFTLTERFSGALGFWICKNVALATTWAPVKIRLSPMTTADPVLEDGESACHGLSKSGSWLVANTRITCG